MNRISCALLLLVLFVIVPRAVNACGCPRISTVLDDYESADLVVIAQWKSFAKAATPNRLGSYISHVTMVVEKVFKGNVKVGEELTFTQGDAILGCSWEFYEDLGRAGERYLLYLWRPEKSSDPFYISTCSRSNTVEGATEDLLYLNNIDKLRGRTRISGVVDVDGGDEEGLQIRIRGKNKTYIATTGKNGVYEIYDLPPGRYSLEPILKFGWKTEEFHLKRQQTRAEWKRSLLDLPPPKKVWFTLRPKRHFGVDINLTLSNRVAGLVTTPAGKPLHDVCVSLVPTNNPSGLACNVFTEVDGRFVIESVEAGSYYLLLNYENVRSNNQPFPKQYYPGVTSPEAAKVLTVKFGESIEDLNFVVRALDETIKLEGVVRYSNGRPASNKWVGFVTPKTGAIDGSIKKWTDKHGRFSLTVLKGLRGEIYSTYRPEAREFVTCASLKKLLKESGKISLVFETQRVTIEANEDKTLDLRFHVSPCR